jgi:hypothetical protein
MEDPNPSTERDDVRKIALLIAAIAVAAALAPAADQAHAAPTPKPKDWRTEINFGGLSGMDPFNDWDASLVSTLEPNRIKNKTIRAKAQYRLDHLMLGATKAKANAIKSGMSATALSAEVAAADTMDPGCQLTSSLPDGFDLCGYNPDGDLMSLWSCSPHNRQHWMWSGLQESDTDIVDAQQSYRVWWKSQAIGCQGTAVNHTVDVKGWEAWRETFPVGGKDNWVILGVQDPPVAGPGPTIYRTGSLRAQEWLWGGDIRGYGTWFVRDGVTITGTSSTSSADNNNASGMWYRQKGYSSYPGPRNYYQAAPNCSNTPNWAVCYPGP